MKNYVYNTEGILSEKLLENFADNLIAVDAIEIYSPCQKLTDKNSDKWTPKYIKKSGCAKKNNRFLRGKMVEKPINTEHGRHVKLKIVKKVKKILIVLENGVSVISTVKESLL